MKFITHSKWSQLTHSAHSLLNLHEKQSLFFSSLWFDNLINTTVKPQMVLIACVVKNDEYLAILPLITDDSGHWQSLSNYYSSLFTLIMAKEQQPTILACLIKGLKTLPFKSLLLEPLDKSDQHIKQFYQQMCLADFNCFENFKFYNWSHPLPSSSFEDYQKQLPSKVNNTIERKHRKLMREHPYKIKLYTQQNIQQAINDYQSVYLASWKANERFLHFTQHFVTALAKKGWLRLGVLYVKHQPIAAQIWLVTHKKANIFRLAYDEQWKQYSPGSILTRYLMQHVIEQDKVTELDFLNGNEKYKQDWMSVQKQRLSYTFAKKNSNKSKFSLVKEKLFSVFNRG